MGGKARATKRVYFTDKRREVYLGCLRRTATHAAAAREAGISERAARRYRARTPAFEALCIEAVREAQRRLAGAAGPFDGQLDPAFESIRRGPDGKPKIQATQPGRWTRAIEERFFAVLGATGNIAASARAVGFTREAIGARRRRWPEFARRMEDAMEEAEIDLEFRLLGLGTGWREAAEAGEADVPPPPQPDTPINPEFALRFLKWREEKRRGKHAPMLALPDAEAVRERIVRKAMAIRRHRERKAERDRREGGEA